MNNGGVISDGKLVLKNVSHVFTSKIQTTKVIGQKIVVSPKRSRLVVILVEKEVRVNISLEKSNL